MVPEGKHIALRTCGGHCLASEWIARQILHFINLACGLVIAMDL